MKYRVPFVNYTEHYHRIKPEIDSALSEVLEGGDFIMRRHLTSLESNIAKFVGVKYAVGVNSGTDALWLSLLAAGISPGQEVVTVSHTFVASIAVIIHCGAVPILVDVDYDYNMDVKQLEKVITNRTRAIMPVHLNGRVCNMTEIMRIAREHGLMVIEDAAQALGASYNGKMSGSFGIAGCFSFYPAKALGCFGDGGIVTTDHEIIANKVRLLRDHCQNRDTGEFLGWGFNSRLDNLQAAILDVKLNHLSKWIARRRDLAAIYQNGLCGISQVTIPPYGEGDIFTNYVIMAKGRDGLAQYLRDNGVEVLISWPKPNHKHEALGLSRYVLPNTEELSRTVLSLPLYPELTDEQADYVISKIEDFYG